MKKGNFYYPTVHIMDPAKITVMLVGDEQSLVTLNYEGVNGISVKFGEPMYRHIGYTNVKFVIITEDDYGDLFNAYFTNYNVVVRKINTTLVINIFKNKNVKEDEND